MRRQKEEQWAMIAGAEGQNMVSFSIQRLTHFFFTLDGGEPSIPLTYVEHNYHLKTSF